MIRRVGVFVAVLAVLAASAAISALPASADGTFSVAPTTLDFGPVAVGATKDIPVVITNVGAASATPNFAGGAPIDPTNFGGSQNCAGKTFAPGESCQFTYSFEPKSEGPLTSQTTIGIDATNYAISMSGIGGAATPTTTTTTPPTTAPTTPTVPSNPGGGGGGGGNTGSGGSGGGSGGPTGTFPAAPSTTVAASGGTRATVEHDTIAPGEEESATATGYKPGEQVSAVMQPNGQDLGSRVADDQGTAHFAWEIDDDAVPGTYEFVATGATSGTARAKFTVAEADDSDSSPWLIIAIVAIIALLIAGLAYSFVRRRRHPNATQEPSPENAATVQQPVVPPDSDGAPPAAL